MGRRSVEYAGDWLVHKAVWHVSAGLALREAGMTAKTTAQRQRELRQNRIEKGLKEVRNLWCHPSDIQSIRDYAKRLAEQPNQGNPKQGAA